MSLIQPLSRSAVATQNPDRELSASAREPRDTDADASLRRAVKEASPALSEVTPVPVRDYENAFALLEGAAKALEFLHNSRYHLQLSVEAVRTQSAEAVAAAEAKAAEWQKAAATLEARSREYENLLVVLQRRVDAAEARAENERERVVAAEQRASILSDVLSNLHDKIMAAFGQGSQVYSTIKVISVGKTFDAERG